jgi:hypothetical protein
MQCDANNYVCASPTASSSLKYWGVEHGHGAQC